MLAPHRVGPDSDTIIAAGSTYVYVPVLTSGRTYEIAAPLDFTDLTIGYRLYVSLYGNTSGNLLVLKQPGPGSDIIQLVASLASGSVYGCQLHYSGAWMVYRVDVAP